MNKTRLPVLLGVLLVLVFGMSFDATTWAQRLAWIAQRCFVTE